MDVATLANPPTYSVLGSLSEREQRVHNIFSDPSKYIYKKLLGHGSYGRVYLVETLTEPVELYALKLIPLANIISNKRFTIVKREAFITKGLDLKYSVNSYGLFNITYLNVPCYGIVEDYFDGQDLERIFNVSGFVATEEFALEVMLKAARALAELAAKGKIVHYDIKPENILYNKADRVIKLIDFGLACRFDDSEVAKMGKCEEVKGTPLYMPPELLNKNFRHMSKLDIWSLGATFYYLVYKKDVIDYVLDRSTDKYEQLAEQSAKFIEPTFPPQPDYPHLQKVLSQCLVKDPVKRISIKALVRLIIDELKVMVGM